MAETSRIVHPIPPLYDENSTVLILGSFPSVKSREAMFFYGHPQNRFWPLLARLFNEEAPDTVEEKKRLALGHRIALWDTIRSCTITGSSSVIINSSRVKTVYCNGAASYKLYQKYIYPINKIKAEKLPSTSPANAAWSMERLEKAWSVIRGE